MKNYWFSLMEMAEILMMNIHSLKIQKSKMFKDSLRLKIPRMQTNDNNNYRKWLVEFWTEISTLTKAIDEHMTKGLFALSLTGNPYSRLPVDMWIEMTMNKGSKMKAVWENVLKNETVLLSHTRSPNLINKIRISTHKLADSKKANKHVHKENQTRRLKAGEEGFQDLANSFLSSTLHSEEVASIEPKEDFATAHTFGQKLVADKEIKKLTRPCTEIRWEASQINQGQTKIPIQCKTKPLKWKTRSWLRWSLVVQKRRCALKK